ncbi:hypothetical protein [Streptomyces sp. NPDC046821]|uniref:hypothetical protein n=1 Tax=Streptomyces sp. NPDC046821 TaxID=3154702 RepID=UPI0033CCDB47
MREAIDRSVATIEICDSRMVNSDVCLGDMVTENASAGCYTLGTQQWVWSTSRGTPELACAATLEQPGTGKTECCA